MFHYLHLKNYPIFKQLQLEEALLRSDQRNWCVVNEGSSPAIVMGISGKPHELIDTIAVKKNNIPVIKRFSGGGTVIVDENTLFITFICQKGLHAFPSFPEPIMQWTVTLYRPLFEQLSFQLLENDYVIGEKKCGGNAQYIKKDRWLHHSSFLWDYNSKNMDYLLHPRKTPQYRKGRNHIDFLCRLCDFFPNRSEFLNSFKKQVSQSYLLQEMTLEEARSIGKGAHRQTTTFLEF